MSYAPFNHSEVVAEVVGPATSKLEEDSRSGSYLWGFWDVVLASHYWDQTPLFSSSVACQEPYRSRSLKKGLGPTVLSLVRNGHRSSETVSHMDSQGAKLGENRQGSCLPSQGSIRQPNIWVVLGNYFQLSTSTKERVCFL